MHPKKLYTDWDIERSKGYITKFATCDSCHIVTGIMVRSDLVDLVPEDDEMYIPANWSTVSFHGNITKKKETFMFCEDCSDKLRSILNWKGIS